MTPTMSAPLRDASRNVALDNTYPRPPGTSTNPLRIPKLESPLNSADIPNPSYRKPPSQLARRQSSSYNHVKNNSLVSNSPFKRSTRIPTPSRATMPSPKEVENNPNTASYKRRQSRGLIGLAKEQVVTKSPFLGEHKRSNSANQLPPMPAFPTRPISCPDVSMPLLPESRPSTPPRPITPRNNRVTDLANNASRSPSPPKSSLASPRRLHGPRSISVSPGCELKRQRRKTVTFDERCDVVEFDCDDISDEVVDLDDVEDGHPEPTCLTTQDIYLQTCAENSFSSDHAQPLQEFYDEHTPVFQEDADHDVFDEDQVMRTPHISRDEIRRRLVEQRNVFESRQVSPEPSFEVSLEHSLSIGVPSHHASFEPTMDSPRLAIRLEQNESMDYTDTGSGSNIAAEMHDALDQFMRGVGSDFRGSSTHDGESMLTDTNVEQETSARLDNSGMSLDTSFNAGGGIEISRQVVGSAGQGSSDSGDTEEAVTPNEHGEFSAEHTRSILSEVEQSFNSEDKNQVTTEATPVADLDLSLSGLQSSHLDTSTPPASPSQDASSFPRRPLGPSFSLPPLAFGGGGSSSTETVLPSEWLPSGRTSLPQAEVSLTRSTSTVSIDSVPPPLPPKDNAIQRREELIRTRRKEMREAETPFASLEGRPSRRRSLSTGDAEDIGSKTPAAQRRAGKLREMTFLDVPIIEREDEDVALSDLIDKELKLRRKPTVKEKNRLYKLRERENTIYASSDDKVSHVEHAGDVDTGKAWRTVRRPSDMNEYSRQIRDFRQQKGLKAHGKVFVKVMSIRGLNVPIPTEPTAFTCTLNNGIHFVTTPECTLARDARIGQEFELIEHSKLEFTLTLKVRRDPHIIAQTKANASPPRPPPVTSAPTLPTHRSGVRSFFHVGSSPKKVHKAAVTVVPQRTAAVVPEPMAENLARYLRPDGTLARAFICFKEIAKRCDTRLFESSFQLIGQKVEGPNQAPAPWKMGEIVLQIFRLPPLPSIPSDDQPQSLDECLRGLRHIAWHKEIYHEGVLTQSGGDCRTWRRRLFRVMGASLIAFNDVTKKPTAKIDLKKALSVEDDDLATTSPGKFSSVLRDEFDDVYRVERSLRLIFPEGEIIQFFADTDEEKARWLEVFRALVGHIPPNPLWAELVWQRKEEAAGKNSVQAQASTSSQAPKPASTISNQ